MALPTNSPDDNLSHVITCLLVSVFVSLSPVFLHLCFLSLSLSTPCDSVCLHLCLYLYFFLACLRVSCGSDAPSRFASLHLFPKMETSTYLTGVPRSQARNWRGHTAAGSLLCRLIQALPGRIQSIRGWWPLSHLEPPGSVSQISDIWKRVDPSLEFGRASWPCSRPICRPGPSDTQLPAYCTPVSSQAVPTARSRRDSWRPWVTGKRLGASARGL